MAPVTGVAVRRRNDDGGGAGLARLEEAAAGVIGALATTLPAGRPQLGGEYGMGYESGVAAASSRLTGIVATAGRADLAAVVGDCLPKVTWISRPPGGDLPGEQQTRALLLDLLRDGLPSSGAAEQASIADTILAIYPARPLVADALRKWNEHQAQLDRLLKRAESRMGAPATEVAARAFLGTVLRRLAEPFTGHPTQGAGSAYGSGYERGTQGIAARVLSAAAEICPDTGLSTFILVKPG